MNSTLRVLSSGPKIEALARTIEGRPDAVELFYDLAETLWRGGDTRGYAELFRRAFLLKPASNLSLRLSQDAGVHAGTSELRERARALIDHGVLYAPVIEALVLGEAQVGNDAEVRRLMDFGRLFHHAAIEPPGGTSLEAFNSALAGEIKSDLHYYDEPPDRAIRHAWRYDKLGAAATPALRTLLRLLLDQVRSYMARLPGDRTHPFLASRPAEFGIDGWAVVSDGASHHESHIHPCAWVTGVYYVVQPEVSRTPDSGLGWLHIGRPPGRGDAAGFRWECRSIPPVPGSFVLMPAYFWHETEPMGVDQERICVAFEVQPIELCRCGG